MVYPQGMALTVHMGNEPAVAFCRHCDTRIIGHKAPACGLHETGTLCRSCWNAHLEQHRERGRISACWSEAGLPLKW